MAQSVTPLPAIGDVFSGQDAAGRELRISGHPESDRLVLSIWQSGHCLATVRLARADVPEVTRALVAALVPAPGPVSVPGPAGTVHELHPGDLDPEVPARPWRRAWHEVTSRLSTALTSQLPGGPGRGRIQR